MLHYHDQGSTDCPSLCFLHGFMGSVEDWTPIVEAMSDDVHCLRVDLPGHGGSIDRPDHLYTMEGATQALADVLDDAGVESCTFIGYSMGGRLALYFSLFHPSRVQRLVLESASPGIDSNDARARRRTLDAERATRIRDDLRSFLEDWYRQPLFSSLQRHDLVEEMVARRGTNDADELACALTGLSPGRQPSLWEHLGEVSVPTLVMTGELDEKYEQITKKESRRIEHAQRVVVPRAGHNVHAERPHVYLAHLARFRDRT